MERLLQTRSVLVGSVVLGLSLAFLINPVTAAVKARTQATSSQHDAEEAQAIADAPAPKGRSAKAWREKKDKKDAAPAATKTAAPAHRPATAPVSRTSAFRATHRATATPHRTTTAARRTTAPRTSTPRASTSRTSTSRSTTAPRRAVTRTTRPAPSRTQVRTPVRKPVTRPRVAAARLVSANEKYGTSRLQQVTVSRLSSSGRRPTAYFIHGGGWTVGSRAEFAAEARRWAARGWTTVNVSYRLNVPGEAMLGDVSTVVDRYEHASYVDPNRQVLVGNSAGGQLATLLATRYPSRFKGVVAWSPVISPQAAYDQGRRPGARGSTAVLSRSAKRLWGSDWRRADAANFVTASTPPLWVAASAGEWVPWRTQGARMCSALGRRCTAAVVSGTLHGSHLMRARPDLLSRAFAWAEAKVD